MSHNILLGCFFIVLGIIYFVYLLYNNYNAEYDEYRHLFRGYYATLILIMLGVYFIFKSS
jgi:membrane protein DedA with SNARE-associated domain